MTDKVVKKNEQWSNLKSMKNSTVFILHVSKFRVKVGDRNRKVLDFDKTYFLENFEFKK